MATVYFSEEHKDLVQELKSNVSHSLPPLFPELRDLMLFAAMLGKKLGKRAERKGIGGEVETQYFASKAFNKDGVIFLLGLLEFQDPEVFKDGAKPCWTLFEEYCAAGMNEIAGWLEDVDDHEEYVRVFQEKIMEVAHSSKKKPKIVVKPTRKLSV